MTLQEIENLKIEDVFFILVVRLLDSSIIPGGEASHYFAEDDLENPKTLYERLIVHSVFEKPSFDAFDSEFLTYQEELLVVENARLQELARVEAIKFRFKNLSDIKQSMHLSGLHVPNVKLFMKKIIEDNDIAKLELLESYNGLSDTLRANQKAEDNRLNELKVLSKKRNLTGPEVQEALRFLLQ